MRSYILILMIFLVAAISCSCSGTRYLRPSYLNLGDTIGVISMSSRVAPTSDTATLSHVMDSLGFGVIYGDQLLSQSDNSFGSDDRARADQFNKMVANTNVKAILMYKGGYGMVRTLDYIDWRKFKQNVKWVCGYSDVTMLHLAAQARGIETLHSDMPTSFGGDSVSLISFINAVTGNLSTIEVASDSLNQVGKSHGRLIGGNLSLLYAAVGTPEAKALKGNNNVLFIEEVGERLYHVDRMMQSLERSGALSRCRAIVVGQMTNISDLERFEVSRAEELISKYCKKYNIPVIFGLQTGHGRPNLSLYLGRSVEVIVRDDLTATIRFH